MTSDNLMIVQKDIVGRNNVRNKYNLIRANLLFYSELAKSLKCKLKLSSHSQPETVIRSGSDLALVSEVYDQDFQPATESERFKYVLSGVLVAYGGKKQDIEDFSHSILEIYDYLHRCDDGLIYLDVDNELVKETEDITDGLRYTFTNWILGRFEIGNLSIESEGTVTVESSIRDYIRSRLHSILTLSDYYRIHLSSLKELEGVHIDVIPTLLYPRTPTPLEIDHSALEKKYDFTMVKYPKSWEKAISSSDMAGMRFKYFLNMGMCRKTVERLRELEASPTPSASFELKSMPTGEYLGNIVKEVSECWVHTSISGFQESELDWFTTKLVEAYYGYSLIPIPDSIPHYREYLAGCSTNANLYLPFYSSSGGEAENLLSGVKQYLGSTSPIDRWNDIHQFRKNVEKYHLENSIRGKISSIKSHKS